MSLGQNRRAMIDGLRREFPQAFELARRIPNPRFARSSPLWAVLAAFGAGLFVSALVTVVLSLLFPSTTREMPIPTPFEFGRIAGTAASLALAWIAGGRNAVIGYVGIVVLERALGLPSQLRFCGMYGPDPNSVAAGACTVGGYGIPLLPPVLGGGVRFSPVRWGQAGERDTHP